MALPATDEHKDLAATPPAVELTEIASNEEDAMPASDDHEEGNEDPATTVSQDADANSQDKDPTTPAVKGKAYHTPTTTFEQELQGQQKGTQKGGSASKKSLAPPPTRDTPRRTCKDKTLEKQQREKEAKDVKAAKGGKRPAQKNASRKSPIATQTMKPPRKAPVPQSPYLSSSKPAKMVVVVQEPAKRRRPTTSQADEALDMADDPEKKRQKVNEALQDLNSK